MARERNSHTNQSVPDMAAGAQGPRSDDQQGTDDEGTRHKMDTVLSVHGLTFHYDHAAVVSDLSFSVHKGDIFGFVGPNGAGKTTTIKLLMGLLTPHTGSIEVLGMDMRRSREAILKRVGSLVETPSLYPHLSARENLRIQHLVHGIPRARIEEVLVQLGLQEVGNRLVKRFSLGMKQRLGIAMALLHTPDLLILDEPVNGLDPAGILEFRLLLKRLAGEDGVTVFLSSHILSELEQTINRVGIISRGRLQFEGSLEGLKSQCAGSLTVAVDNTERAIAVLQRGGYTVKLRDIGTLTVAVKGNAEAAQLNAVLTTAGIGVYHLSFEQPNLEQRFLEIVRAPETAVPE
jgi:lantibiotic transport system ATP-binding protein